jgi:hypothetical protein
MKNKNMKYYKEKYGKSKYEHFKLHKEQVLTNKLAEEQLH